MLTISPDYLVVILEDRFAYPGDRVNRVLLRRRPLAVLLRYRRRVFSRALAAEMRDRSPVYSRTVTPKKSASKSTPKAIRIPSRKISATILDFGEPLLAQLPDPPPAELLQEMLKIVITVWNALVMAESPWNNPQYLEMLHRMAAVPGAPPELKPAIAELAERRRQHFKDDPRAVGEWKLVAGRGGDASFQCDARLPPGYTAKS